ACARSRPLGPARGAAYRASWRAGGLQRQAESHGELADAYAAHEKTIHQLLSAVQHDVANGIAQARAEAINAVLARNYPAYPPSQFDLSFDDDNLPGYIQALQGNTGSPQRLRNLVMQSVGLYRFLGRRDFTAVNPWQVWPACPHLRHQLRRRGDTLLTAQGLWQSIDTQSFHALRFN